MSPPMHFKVNFILSAWQRAASFLFRVPADPFEFLWGLAAAGWGVSCFLTPDLFNRFPKAFEHVAAPYGEVIMSPEVIGGIFFGCGLLQMTGAFVSEAAAGRLRVGRFRCCSNIIKIVAAVATLILWVGLTRAMWKAGATTGCWIYAFMSGIDGLIILRLKLLAKVRELQGRGLLPVSGLAGTRMRAFPGVGRESLDLGDKAVIATFATNN